MLQSQPKKNPKDLKSLMQKTVGVEHAGTPPLRVERKNAQKEGHVVKRN